MMRDLIRHILREEIISEIKKLTNDEYIDKVSKKHNGFYDYSKVNYVNSRTPITIICPKHGEFNQSAGSHMQGQGCPKCRYEKSSSKTRTTVDDFIERANNKHDNKYTYEKSVYKNSGTKLIVTCPTHGDFLVTPGNHLSGSGCPICYGTKKLTTQEFIDRATKVHGDEYDYSKVNYKNGHDDPVEIICKKHGPFLQLPYNHTKGDRCPICVGNQKSNTEEFIKKAIKVHGDRYDYSKTDYKTNKTPIVIICEKPNHGEFVMTPNSHIGQKTGCPICSESKGEILISTILDGLNIVYDRQKRFKDCTNLKTGRYCRTLPFDFYLPEYNTMIEYDGIQHFKEVGMWGGEDSLKSQQLRDQIKNKYCEDNGINMLRIPYTMKSDEVFKTIKNKLGNK
jgi:rubrerythrin/very-short-patch-repair endonuclease